MAFLSAIQAGVDLKETTDVKDRSDVNLANAAPDALEDEEQRWEYFFSSGARTWCDEIAEFTFSSSFCNLDRDEASIIVQHWEERGRVLASAAAQGSPRPSAAVDQLLDDTIKQLAGLCERLDATVAKECALSAEGKAFVKLSTRSPKDSKKALAKAEQAYRARMADEPDADENRRWIVLSEEVTKSSAVSSGAEALVLLLDSDRVFEDLEYALRGPPVAKATDAAAADAAGTDEVERTWNMELVARAWDPRLTPQSEFRGIAWDGALTCLCQYFHPLFFEGLRERADEILADVQATYNSEAVKRAVQKLGGHCIIDFAWLGPGEVIIIELNPFDGVALGTFPASTGLFLWEDERDNKIMKGEAPFEFRLREEPLDGPTLRVQCNQDWRAIVSS